MKLLVLGDSHTEVFPFLRKNNLLPDYIQVDSYGIPGATAQGIHNPKSKTKALDRYKSHVEMTSSKYDWVGLMIGEVDCGFALWYRSQQFGIPMEKQLRFAINQYEFFVQNELEPIFGKNILLCGAHLPTLRNPDDNEDIVVKRARMEVSIKASYKKRTDLTLRYNKIISSFAENCNYTYGDITRFCIDEKTRLLKESIPSTGNHHLPIRFAADCWKQELVRLFG